MPYAKRMQTYDSGSTTPKNQNETAQFTPLYSPYIRLCDFAVTCPPHSRSARFCYTWVIPLHFSLTSSNRCLTISSNQHSFQQVGARYFLPALVFCYSEWPPPTRTRVFRNPELKPHRYLAQLSILTGTFPAQRTCFRITKISARDSNA